MSYQVIARKFRPQVFSDLLGQNHISQTLINALKNQRIPQALLFTGPRGTGKTSTARILAKALRCPNAVDFVPCGVCTSCVEIAAGRSTDVIEIDGASHNGVDSIRELREGVAFRPSSGHYKIYIIDEVHMLSTAAFNALLKTLEEPPPHVIFMLATTEVSKIPMTILSRCQRFDFRRITSRVIVERMEQICAAEGIVADHDSLWIIARQGSGSMRDALSLLDQVITFSQSQMTAEKVLEILGLADRNLTLELLQTLIRREPKKILPLLEKFTVSGGESELLIHELLELIRATLLLKIAGENTPPDFLELPDSEIRFLMDLGQTLQDEDLHLLFDMTLKGEQDVLRSSDPRLVLEMVLLRMAVSPSMIDIKSWITGGAQAAAPTSAQGPSVNHLGNPQPVASLQNARPATPTNGPRPMQNMAPTAPGFNTPTAPGFNTPTAPGFNTPTAPGLNTPTASGYNSSPANGSGTPGYNSSSSAGNSSATGSHAGTMAPRPAPRGPAATLSASEKWYELVQFTKSDEPLLGAKLENLLFLGEFKSDAGGKIRLQIPPKLGFLQEQLTDANIKNQIDKRVETTWGKGYSADIEVSGKNQKHESTVGSHTASAQNSGVGTGTMSAADQTKNREMKQQEDMMKQISENPKVKLAQSVFNGKIQIRKKGGIMKGGMAQLMKQANQMQMRMKKTQEELSQRTYEGSSGGGAVKITVDGDHFIKSVVMDPEVLKGGDAEMLQDMIMAATNDAVKIAKDTSAKEMEKITGGMGIPGLF